tara:strand:- start:75035 stop:75673 length:639 start_codon:yes stop_codon:yes gene_type:complete
MGSKPLFKRGEVTYLASSTIIGRLDSFKISHSKQIGPGTWVYPIRIGKKPPHRSTIGDTWDKRIDEGTLVYNEPELITFCEAVGRCINALNNQIASVIAKQTASCSGTDEPVRDPFEPRFEIGEYIHIDASARIGFLQCAKVTGVTEIGVQPGSRKARFVYFLDITRNHRPQIYYREDELITECEACNKVLTALDGQLQDLVEQRDMRCPGI